MRRRFVLKEGEYRQVQDEKEMFNKEGDVK